MATTTINLGLSLDGLSNVDSTGKNNGDILRWNSTTNKWEDGVDINLGNTNLTSNRNTAIFTLNGVLSSNKLEISNGTNAVLHIAGNNTVWARGAGNVTTNTAFGEFALDANTTGSNNTAFGQNALTSITTGINSTAFGFSALQNATGSSNTAIGRNALVNITSGTSNVAVGQDAGRFTLAGASNLTNFNSIFIGLDTRSSANGNGNEIVIGYNAIGNGSNTATIGNSSIVATYLQGQVKVGSFASAPTGIEGAIYYDSVTKKHYGFDGTTWNAFY
jgi:hypothetical protein